MELIERLVALEASRNIGHLPGTFVGKKIGGEEYCYFQYLDPGGRKRQAYVGKKDAALKKFIELHKGARLEAAPDLKSIKRLCSILRAGGAITTDAASGRVLKSLADAGVFKLGGIIIGAHAFAILGNLLGVKWGRDATRTQDIDIAARPNLDIALPEISADIPGTLQSLEMGFLPVPALDAKSPSTFFKVRGHGLRVDLLTPAKGGRQVPVALPRFKAAAQPLPYLEFLMEHPVRCAVIDGAGLLASVPDPARFAFHKLIVATERPSVMHAKREKDFRQAGLVFEVLLDERPGDLLLAWDDLCSRGEYWQKRVHQGLAGLERTEPDTTSALRHLLGPGAQRL